MPVNLPEMLVEAEKNWSHLWVAQMTLAYTDDAIKDLFENDKPFTKDDIATVQITCMRCGILFRPSMIKKICPGQQGARPNNFAYGSKKKARK